jgi:hypothetical protein
MKDRVISQHHHAGASGRSGMTVNLRRSRRTGTRGHVQRTLMERAHQPRPRRPAFRCLVPVGVLLHGGRPQRELPIYSGGSWSSMTSYGSIEGGPVSFTSASFCVAGGASQGNNEVFTYNGSGWSAQQSPFLIGVSCASVSFCAGFDNCERLRRVHLHQRLVERRVVAHCACVVLWI